MIEKKPVNQVVVIIPARYGSKRFPGKPLIKLAGQPLIVHVWQRAREIPGIDRVIVATDDDRIFKVIGQTGGEAVMTPVDLPSGSDRVGWVASSLDCEIIVNLQGDEPLIDTRAVAQAVKALQLNPHLNVATLGFPLEKEKVWKDPNVVKVLTDENNDALYFSRLPIPFFRDLDFSPTPGLFQHLGVYIYRKKFLMEFLNWSPSPLEKAEKLEQLRILSKGFKIKIIPTSSPSFGVDTPDDVSRVEEMLIKRNEN
jgi:3-deoxy-manno-octulosonate cytidylyltransferase (CMP-KDO synthetase)